jgi:hypothetical protein
LTNTLHELDLNAYLSRDYDDSSKMDVVDDDEGKDHYSKLKEEFEKMAEMAKNEFKNVEDPELRQQVVQSDIDI